MEERNKVLTEAMGDCYHEFENCMGNEGGDGFICDTCGESIKGTSVALIKDQTRNDFLTWEGFGLLWTWASEQGWWKDFLDSLGDFPGSCIGIVHIHWKKIDPVTFAKAVADFLQKK